MSANGAPLSPPPRNPDNPGRGPLIIGLTWTFTSIAIIVVALRFYIRRRTRILWWDDWTMLLALMFQIGAQGCVTRAYLWGLGKHDRDLTVLPQLIHIQKWNYIAVVPNLLASSIARISAALLLIRLFGNKKWLKWYLIIFTSIQTILVIAEIPVLWTTSRPVEGLWNPLIPAVRRPNTVSGHLVYTIQAMLTFSDLTFVLFPVMIIYKLNMPLRRKLGLMLLMMLSLVTMTVSIMKTIQVKISVGRTSDNTQDIQYHTSLIQLWSGVEQCLVITLSCVPTLRTWSKLALPAVLTMASSLVRILTRTTRASPAPSKGDSIGPHSKHYYDLELQPQRHHHASAEGTGEKSSVKGNQIRQTNDLTISTSSLIQQPPPSSSPGR